MNEYILSSNYRRENDLFINNHFCKYGNVCLCKNPKVCGNNCKIIYITNFKFIKGYRVSINDFINLKDLCLVT